MFESTVGESPRILIVEDDEGVAELYSHWLNDGFTIDIAHNCTDAYWRFLTPIDVLVLDRNLPGGSGDELLTDVRELGLDCRVVMVTAEKPTIDIVEMEFDEYLRKPITEEELRSTVTRLIEQKNFRDKLVEFNRLSSKKSLLQTYCSSVELAGNKEYAILEDRLRELRAELLESQPELPFAMECESVSGD